MVNGIKKQLWLIKDRSCQIYLISFIDMITNFLDKGNEV